MAAYLFRTLHALESVHPFFAKILTACVLKNLQQHSQDQNPFRVRKKARPTLTQSLPDREPSLNLNKLPNPKA